MTEQANDVTTGDLLEWADNPRAATLYDVAKIARELQHRRASETMLREALEKIAEGRDAGRHDGLREECPLHDQYTMWLEARAALERT